MGEALAGRRRWIWVAAAVVVLALIGYGVVHALTAGATEKPKAAATVAVDRGAVTTEVATTGTLQPAQTRSLSFAVKGTVESISVRAGSTVGAGQTLAKVDDTDAAKAVDDAQSSLDDAESALTDARDTASKTSSTTAACGTNVAAAWPATSATASPSATTTTSPTPTATATATASPTRTATAKPTATATSTRGSGSGNGGGTGSCAGAGGGSGQQGGGQQGGGDQILSAQQRVIQATTALEEAEEALAGATITAPISGKIISVTGKVGTQVSAGSAFITLADVYDMQIDADYPEADADRLAVKQSGVVTLADRPGESFKATVVQVDPTGTSDGTMVKYGVVLSFVDAPKDLLVGQSANVKITTGSKADVLRVPSTAVHNVQGDTGTVLKGGVPTKVGVGLRGDQYTEITSGLTEGDQVARSW
ncbi:efflux RND transporter periplasmic adaptor subunit [Actinoplanes sp. KI2]|uniref:efflux RND transporter periplasmic adaptor subunit n=1 Tax=Actinoplanes sp. KI2 TaxID=2983315 RepID=UPI0021D582E4|nr:efflux RND transporter periplasmic adaptor subunit [Actinoplanes sp. KI2]MCU7725051.1 efflux RND transporter periplasmic adaptor subunit [Actinoplanes sp. KI2]